MNNNTQPATMNSCKSIAKEAKRKRFNRVYYKHNFTAKPLTELGVVRTNEKNAFDLVCLNPNNNEQIRFYGINKLGTYFELTINISSLFSDVQKPHRESLLRLGQVKFVYEDKSTNWKYSYEHEDLLDYQKKRASCDFESSHVYRIGSLSLEISAPFALSRISFNGMIKRKSTQTQAGELISARFNISTHPTGDKFDYAYSFSSKFLADSLHKSSQARAEPKQLMPLTLEDRIDQTFMFRCELELLNENVKTRDILWGAKSRCFLNPFELVYKSSSQPLESLLIWSELGTIVHLRRPVGHPDLIYGMVHCGFDYSSPLYEASCLVPDSGLETSSNFGRLASFSNIAPGTSMSLVAFRSKSLKIEIADGINQGPGTDYAPFQLTIDGVPGWGLCRCDNPAMVIKDAQAKLLTLDIHDRCLTYRLSSEALLGGKGKSLVGLSFLTADKNQSGVDMRQLIDPSGSLACNGVAVPRGVIVTSLAYQLWLESNPSLETAIHELDETRKALAARSYYVNPLSEKHLTLGQHQQILREKCQKVNQLLNSCPLPTIVEQQLHAQLISIFGQTHFNNTGQKVAEDDVATSKKLFAVRSSAMGEDAIETSAAGQMKTILDAITFEDICRAVVACWASQFELEAVTYKTQNSLLFNWPMAVVVQELVPCYVAGVAATCNPIDGRPGQLEITANRGLGEGVVSGKATDTIRVKLESQLSWDAQSESYVGPLKSLDGALPEDCMEKVIGTAAEDCCLNNDQITALSSLLVWLRNRYAVKQREIEWGITLSADVTDLNATSENGARSPRLSNASTSSSSSYCSTISKESQLHVNSRCKSANSFTIHLLQSRPLTNLSRANNFSIAHELDSGIGSPVDVITRANLGEVMPGCVSPLFVTHFLSSTIALSRDKPYEKNHTVEPYSGATFSVSAQIVSLLLTNAESINRLVKRGREFYDNISMMIGYSFNEDYTRELVEQMQKVRHNPTFQPHKAMLMRVLAFDMGYIDAKNVMLNKSIKLDLFVQKLTTDLDKLMDEMDNDSSESADQENGVNNKVDDNKSKPNERRQSTYTPLVRPLAIVKGSLLGDTKSKELRNMTRSFYDKLINETDFIKESWDNHLRATLLSISFNIFCLHIMNQQPFYLAIESEDERKMIVMNDFSVLIRDSNKDKTESGDISVALDSIVDCLKSEGKLEEAKSMSIRDLYASLCDKSNRAKSAIKFRDFMDKNGHRTFKEFDYANLTWLDDPSYVMKSLGVRMKQHDRIVQNSETQVATDNKAKELKDIHSRITAKRGLLLNYIVPRAQRAIARRENTKSTLIKTINMYRKGFRSLGALLCLEGKLSDINLIYYMSLDELNSLVMGTDERRADLSRLVYKARRRQQVFRSLEGLSFPETTLNVMKAYNTIDDALDGKPLVNSTLDTNGSDELIKSSIIVRGMTSCNGIVTGRACVVNTLDEMELVQPNDILITYSIDVSWTVYFFTISGIVTEVGGIVSHGAVVAREYGIPTLCMAAGACTKFKTGQIVTLDANKAVCYLASEPETVAQQKEEPTDSVVEPEKLGEN